MVYRNPNPRRGYTLFELMLVLALLVVIGALVWPNLTGPLDNQKLRKSADLIRAELAGARNQAMRTGRIQAFRYSTGAGEYTIEPWFANDDYLESNVQTAGLVPLDQTAVMVQAKAVKLDDGIIFSGGEVEVDLRAMEASRDTIRATSVEPTAAPVILFYPDGSSSTARLILTNEEGYFVVIQLRGLTGIARMTDLLDANELQLALNPMQ
jgi:prepilin-type N-terminal cleavage/methylation domain-containing protein